MEDSSVATPTPDDELQLPTLVAQLAHLCEEGAPMEDLKREAQLMTPEDVRACDCWVLHHAFSLGLAEVSGTLLDIGGIAADELTDEMAASVANGEVAEGTRGVVNAIKARGLLSPRFADALLAEASANGDDTLVGFLVGACGTAISHRALAAAAVYGHESTLEILRSRSRLGAADVHEAIRGAINALLQDEACDRSGWWVLYLMARGVMAPGRRFGRAADG